MHASFTGSARRPRQVNLSGRPPSNPWAALPGSSTKPGHNATNSAVAHAQADRARRQHDREKLIASRKVQKTWRAHSSRRVQKAKWREEWDAREEARLGRQGPVPFNVSDAPAPAYIDTQVLERQLRLLVNFQEYRRQIVRDNADTFRLLHFAKALRATTIFAEDATTRTRLAKLGLIAIRHIKSIRMSPADGFGDDKVTQLAKLITFLTWVAPQDLARSSAAYFDVLGDLLDVHAHPNVQNSSADAIVGLLSASTTVMLQPYQALASILLTRQTLSSNTRILQRLAASINYRLLLQVSSSTTSTASSGDRLWQLAYVVWIERQLGNQLSAEDKFNYVKVLSILLSGCANEIAERMGILDVPMNATNSTGPIPLERFLSDNLKNISSEASVKDAIATISEQTAVSQGSDFESTKRLADYAVAMLRAFSSNGEKARHIRMWLWRTSVTTTAGATISTLEFLWETITTSKVFRRVSSNHRDVLSALREASPETFQIGHPPPTAEEIDHWQVEWRIILFFMELYSFVLKIIDDDEFFSDSPLNNNELSRSSISYAKTSLALQDAAKLTMFLKNLAFTLYWNAAELVPTTDSDDLESLAGLFGAAAPSETHKLTSRAESQTLTGNGVSHSYLKGLSTSLLRMLHERDSRRRFVPANGWLMTNQVDMTGFIPAVVDEEEKRYQIDDDDEELNDPEIDYAALTEDSPRSLFAHLMSGSGGFNYSQASSRHNNTERQRQQARKKRMIESLAPRLEILRNLPFFIPFDTRVKIFREFVYKDQLRRRNGYVDADIWRMSVARSSMGRDINGQAPGHDVISRQHAEISREHVFEDAYNSYYPLGDKLKEPIQISFIDKFGAPEAGIDGGGVTKEFLTSVTSEALDPTGSSMMFVENAQHYLYPNPSIWQETQETLRRSGVREGTEAWNYRLREFLRRFEFLGRVIGKCLYEGILIDVNFAGFFLLKWALTGGNAVATNESGYRASINDLREYDEELYQGLLKLKSYPGNVEADFGLNFTINDTLHINDKNGHEQNIVRTVSLIPDGANKVVDNVLRYLYIDRLVKYRLQDQPEKITNAFLRGLGQIISPSWLAMFNQKELQKLVGGDNTELDIADLRRNTLYGGLYVIGDDGLEHPTVELFWKAMQEMDDGDRRKVLKFVTSTPRAPLLGFSNLNPKFSIRDSSADQARLPSTSTCVNLLKLPRYGDLATMKDKLLYAANSGAGFDLS